ncbi:MAG: GLPGLI family protein [Chitinophagaceae bacterium]|nr:MAG: GLPGLI family protein [Chitinophagaceae bacterium]
MKPLNTLVILLLSASTTFAQKPDKALISVKYAYSHMRDTTDRGNFYRETMVLIAGKNASAFLSYDGILNDIQTKKSFEQQIREQNGNITSLTMPKSTRLVSQNQHYYFASEGKFFTHERLGVIYETEQSADKIAWKISNETLNLEGIQCKKATARYKGRDWTVWFAEELPFASGPWKLVGLPGLVLQAHDENKEIRFDFAGLEKIEAKPKSAVDPSDNFGVGTIGSSNVLEEDEIKLPIKNVVKTTITELARLKKARAADPQGFLRAQLSGAGITGEVSSSARPTNAPKKTIINNPIEKTNN